MRTKFLLLFLNLFSFFAILHSQDRNWEEELGKSKLNTFYLRWSIEGYYRHYFEFPNDLESFIDYEKEVPDSLNLAFLEYYRDHITVNRTDSLVTFLLDDIVLIKVNPPLVPWELLDVNFPQDYYRVLEKYLKPRYFNENERIIFQTNELDSVFHRERRNLQDKYLIKGDFLYPMLDFEGQYPVYTFFEFKYNDDLYYLKGERFESELLFWSKLKEFLFHFTHKNKVKKIIFTLPEYFLLGK